MPARAAKTTLLALVLALAGCGDRGGTTSTAGAATTARADAAAAPAQEPAVGDAAGEGARAAASSRQVRLKPVGRFTSPLLVTSPPRDRRRVFVVEQAGRIRVVRDGRTLARPFLDIRSLVTSGGEQGLLGLAFAPDYASSRRFYVYFTDKGQRQRIVEYRRSARSADVADRGSARLVLRMADPEANHNGGQLAFGPDGLLYAGTGDGGGANDQHGARGNAQDRGSLLGKLLRIDPRARGGRPYTTPASNPFAQRREVYAYGLRNPWRFSFDRSTGDLAIADVGQDAVEEVDFVRRGDGLGANFGWRPFEGGRRNFADEDAPGHVPPVLTKQHADGWCSITGGVVVRDPDLPSLAGRYVYGDFCKGQLRSARLQRPSAKDDRSLGLARVGSLSSFGEDARGRVYVVSLAGPVYRLAPA